MYRLRRIGTSATINNIPDVFVLDKMMTRIGRHSQNDIFLDSSVLTCFLSRWHAEIHRIHIGGQDRLMLRDNGLNGTYVNDRRVSGNHILEVGDKVAFGHPNGKFIKPGDYSPQPLSEFLFMFEETPGDIETQSGPLTTELPSEVRGQETPTVLPQNPPTVSRRLLPSPPPTLTDISNKPKTIRSLSCKDQDQGDSQGSSLSDDTEGLGSLLKSVQQKLDASGSDSDIFDNEPPDETKSPSKTTQSSTNNSSSLTVTQQPTNENSCSNTEAKQSTNQNSSSKSETHQPTNQSTPVIKNTKSESKQTSSTKRTSKRTRKRRTPYTPNKKGRQSTSSDDKYHEVSQSCHSADCVHPTGSKLSWVACDDCDHWYHTLCVQCSYDQVKLNQAQFHCGCV